MTSLLWCVRLVSKACALLVSDRSTRTVDSFRRVQSYTALDSLAWLHQPFKENYRGAQSKAIEEATHCALPSCKAFWRALSWTYPAHGYTYGLRVYGGYGVPSSFKVTQTEDVQK
eukprot:5046039-Amphidinium_carterae.1